MHDLMPNPLQLSFRTGVWIAVLCGRSILLAEETSLIEQPIVQAWISAADKLGRFRSEFQLLEIDDDSKSCRIWQCDFSAESPWMWRWDRRPGDLAGEAAEELKRKSYVVRPGSAQTWLRIRGRAYQFNQSISSLRWEFSTSTELSQNVRRILSDGFRDMSPVTWLTFPHLYQRELNHHRLTRMTGDESSTHVEIFLTPIGSEWTQNFREVQVSLKQSSMLPDDIEIQDAKRNRRTKLIVNAVEPVERFEPGLFNLDSVQLPQRLEYRVAGPIHFQDDLRSFDLFR